MRVFDPGQVPDHWVKYSALLDIWQDEEEPGDLKDFGVTLGLPEGTLSQFRDWLLSGKDKLPSGEGEAATHEDDAASKSVKRFFGLKRRRVWANLRLDRTSFELANDVAEHQQWSHLELLDVVRTAMKDRREILNRVFLECATALGNTAGSPPDPQRQTLQALWHTELCATAPDESTLGLVRVLLPKDIPENVSEVFRSIANHNRARCHSHLHQYEEAVRELEELADRAATGKIDDPIIRRLVGLPTLASMADALTHLLRHVEARWYWTKGMALAEQARSPYWRRYFDLKLADSRAYRPAVTAAKGDPPRLHSLFQGATRRALEVAWQAEDPPSKQGSDTWLRSIYWKLAWHAAEPRQLLSALQGTMEDIRAITEARNRRMRNPDLLPNASVDLDLLERGLLAARACVEHAEEGAVWLCPSEKAIEQQSKNPGTGKLAWEVLWKTVRALNEVEKFKKDAAESAVGVANANLEDALLRWREMLKKRAVGNLDTFRKVAPAVELEILRDRPTVDCLANPDGDSRSDRTCPSRGCPVCSLLDLEATAAGRREPHLAHLEYVLTTMARNAAEFSRYLGGGTGEGTVERPSTPKVEFVSLRRWNSFSPNLGSLAADTVGGGYLLRVYTGTRYLGIAIDPGYNFLENLFNEGFTIADVDLVAVTHAHPDHTDSITNFLTLLRESEKRSPKPKSTIRFAMSEGVLARYQQYLQLEVAFVPEVVMLTWPDAPGNAASRSELAIFTSGPEEVSLDFRDLLRQGEPVAYVKAIPAYHDDGTRKDSIGFKITVPQREKNGEPARSLVVGVLGDSRYHPGLSTELKKCDLVVLHLGAVLDDDSYKDAVGALSKEQWEHLHHLHGAKHPDCTRTKEACAQEELLGLTKENNLYWLGATKLICDLLPTGSESGHTPLVVLSEFGEELRGGLRADLARRLERHFWSRMPKAGLPGVIPADVGLRIDVREKKVRCAVCDRYCNWQEMDAIAVQPADEGLFFVCRDCQSVREHELREILSRRRSQVRPPQKLSKERTAEAQSVGPTPGA